MGKLNQPDSPAGRTVNIHTLPKEQSFLHCFINIGSSIVVISVVMSGGFAGIDDLVGVIIFPGRSESGCFWPKIHAKNVFDELAKAAEDSRAPRGPDKIVTPVLVVTQF